MKDQNDTAGFESTWVDSCDVYLCFSTGCTDLFQV